MIKILIGGSPCTYWSVAQKKGREVEAEGLGWELFRNYLIAKEKFKPDFSSMRTTRAPHSPLKPNQPRARRGAHDINSALVSAQSNQRFYAFNWNIDQPADRGIMLKDILETTTSERGTSSGLQRSESDARTGARTTESCTDASRPAASPKQRPDNSTDRQHGLPSPSGSAPSKQRQETEPRLQSRVYSPKEQRPVRRRRRSV